MEETEQNRHPSIAYDFNQHNSSYVSDEQKPSSVEEKVVDEQSIITAQKDVDQIDEFTLVIAVMIVSGGFVGFLSILYCYRCLRRYLIDRNNASTSIPEMSVPMVRTKTMDAYRQY